MKRFIIYTLLGLFSLASFPSDSQAALPDRDRDNKPRNETMKMKPKKLSKHTAKLRKQRVKDRNKQMADIKKSNQQRKRK